MKNWEEGSGWNVTSPSRARLKITPRGYEICSTQNSLPRGHYPNYPVTPNYPGNHPWGNELLPCPKTLSK